MFYALRTHAHIKKRAKIQQIFGICKRSGIFLPNKMKFYLFIPHNATVPSADSLFAAANKGVPNVRQIFFSQKKRPEERF